MVITVKFKGEEKQAIICDKCYSNGSTYTLENAFICGRIYDILLIDGDNIESIGMGKNGKYNKR